MDITTRQVLLIFLVTLLSTLPESLPGIPNLYAPYVKAIIGAVLAALIFLQKSPPSGPQRK
jgi:hypothetical protein